MANDKNMELKTALQKEITNINNKFLIPMQRQMYECSANCCRNENAKIEYVDSCVQQCSLRVKESQNLISSQINIYQDRLQRCVSLCNDEAKDTLGTNPTDAEVEKASRAFEKCAIVCIDKHMELLPQFMRKVHEVLAKNLPAAED